MSSTHSRFVVVFFILVALFSVYLYTLSLQNKAYWWDEAVYLGLAKNILANHVYGINVNFQYETFRPPLFPVMLSALSLFGEVAEKILSPIFYFLSVVVTYFFARKLFGKGTGLLSAIFLATSSLLIFFSSKVLTESLSVLLFVSSMYVFYKSFEDRKYLIITGFLTALAVLTHYQEALLFVIYAVFLLTKSRKQISSFVFSKTFLIAALVFIATLSPWLYLSFKTYGSVFGALQDSYYQFSAYPSLNGPWYFYLQNIFDIFGLPIVFLVPAMIAYKKFGAQEKFILIAMIVPLLVLSFVFGMKDERYILMFTPVFYIFSAYGFSRLDKMLNRKYFELVAILFALPTLIFGLNMIYGNYNSGTQIKQATVFLQQFSDKYVVAENYPVINYVSGKDAFRFPLNRTSFESLASTYNIHYVVVDNSELYQSPPYVANLTNQFPTIAVFGSSAPSTEVRILKIS